MLLQGRHQHGKAPEQLFLDHLGRQTLPTAIGLPVIEQARVMLGALQTIRQTVDSVRPMLRGTIRLASFPMVLASFLPPLLRQFNRLYPGIEVVALEVSDDEVETLLAAGLVDVDVVLNPENLGVTLVPEMTLPADRQGLRVIALSPRIERVFSVVLPAGQAASPAVQALLDLLADTARATTR